MGISFSNRRRNNHHRRYHHHLPPPPPYYYSDQPQQPPPPQPPHNEYSYTHNHLVSAPQHSLPPPSQPQPQPQPHPPPQINYGSYGYNYNQIQNPQQQQPPYFSGYHPNGWNTMMRPVFYGPLALVYAGTTLKDLSDVTHKWSEFSIGRWAFLISSLVISVILMVCVTKVAQNALRKALAEHGGDLNGAVAASPELNVTTETQGDLNEPLLIKIEPQSPQNQENNSH
ncbi:hypothetical protein F2Q68_00022378 [Brassica cretica]|uniref:Uncharacterized protein n=1 Tax=Brassica cretica TaxID=69181 RepID=A0A8S9FVV7_BRACR|nr:hypothetical protein F2Q68_00022378 [Brassica cretica]